MAAKVNDFKLINPLSANPTKCSNTHKQFVGKLPTNCLGVFDHFVILVLKGLISTRKYYLLDITLQCILLHFKRIENSNRAKMIYYDLNQKF